MNKFSILKNKYFTYCWFLILLSLGSCSSTRSLSYFADREKENDFSIQNQTLTYPILKGEILYISVSSADLLSNSIFNAVNNGGNVQATSQGIASSPGYLVEEDGSITFPKLGHLAVAGKTKENLRKEIEQSLSVYLKDPVITIRNLSYSVTVLGEVARPGIYTTQKERMTLLEAIGSAGDLTDYGKRENILLIREKDKNQQYHRINLNNRASIAQEYYYLRPNDVIYVEPIQSKKFASSNYSRVAPILISSLSLLISALFYFK